MHDPHIMNLFLQTLLKFPFRLFAQIQPPDAVRAAETHQAAAASSGFPGFAAFTNSIMGRLISSFISEAPSCPPRGELFHRLNNKSAQEKPIQDLYFSRISGSYLTRLRERTYQPEDHIRKYPAYKDRVKPSGRSFPVILYTVRNENTASISSFSVSIIYIRMRYNTLPVLFRHFHARIPDLREPL